MKFKLHLNKHCFENKQENQRFYNSKIMICIIIFFYNPHKNSSQG